MTTLKAHLFIPDCQVKEGVPLDHLDWIGQYIVDKKPDVIICAGDFADMPSLSSYDKGRKDFEGRRYKKDIQAVHEGMARLLNPLNSLQSQQRKNKIKVYKPRMALTLGNHENRINRAIQEEAILEGTISINDLGYEEWGWEVIPYLETVEHDGILYSHFFPRNPNGRIMQNKHGAPSARAQVIREMQSCTSGHLQGLDFSIYQTGSHRKYGLICGSCYLHDDEYLTPQGTHYWRGIIYKHEVVRGEYDIMAVSLGYLCRRYGTQEQIKQWGNLK
jgi:hypothetical protein